MDDLGHLAVNKPVFAVKTVTTDGTRASEGTLMTMFGPCLYMGPALEGLMVIEMYSKQSVAV